jgi:hypothetical protein
MIYIYIYIHTCLHISLFSCAHFVFRICLLQAVKKMGLWGLCTRGLPLRIVMIGTLTGAQWGIYDAVKVSFGL